jgi:DNA-binding SARP family transcriptional activator
MGIEFRILGPLELSVDGRVVPLGSPKQRALLGLLLVHANETLSRDRLIEELWGEAAPATVESAFHSYLSRLRRLLESGGVTGALVRDGYGYRLRVEPAQLDVTRFEGLVDEGGEALAAGKVGLAADRFRQALVLWRGPPLADLQSERFAIETSVRLEERRVSLLEQRLEADLALGRHREVVAELQALVAEHPYRERLRAQLMLALYRSGRQAEALRAYQEARRTLADELGLEPGQELKELEQAILGQDPTLAAQSAVESRPEREPEPLPPAGCPLPAPREERKVVTVLFADPGGFADRAEGVDPEDIRLLQERYWVPLRAEIERYGGTVDRFVGDAVVALFGAPRAHEDDPERAVRAALAIRDFAEGEGIEVRIGITTGEALVQLGAPPHAGEGIATGDVIIGAPRLGAAAAPHGILVGEGVYHATRHLIEYRGAAPVEARGKAGPVSAWEAVGALTEAGIREETPFVGREGDLRMLEDTLARVGRERSCQLVTLLGVPGIGKSRLVRELAGRGGDVVWCQGRCLPYGEGVTFWALGEIVKAQVGIAETDTAEVVERKLALAVEEEWIRVHLRPLVGLTVDRVGEGVEREEVFAAWRWFLEQIAERRPLALVLEDLHWADESLLEFIDYLVEWASGVPLLVLCTARPELLERRPGWGGGKANALTVSLPALTDDETGRLIAALIGRKVMAAEARVALLSRAGGNPLYAEQFARMVIERGVGELPVPETVQGIIAARLDLLEPEQKALLGDAAVAGKVFWLGAVSAISAADPRAAASTLHALERKGFVRRERESSIEGDAEYAFLHVLVREVAYGQIPRAPRAEKHRSAAEWIEGLGRLEDHAEMLAHHYREALLLARAAGLETTELERPARRALRDAGDRALALHAYAAARGFYEQALELWPTDDADQPALLLRRAKAVLWGGDYTRVDLFEQARNALLEVGDRVGAAEAQTLGALPLRRSGRPIEALDAAQSAAALLAEAPPSPAKAYVLANLARLLSLAARRDKEAIEMASTALGMAEELGRDELKAHALNTIGMTRVVAGDPAGIEQLEASLDLALEHGSPFELGRVYNNLRAGYEAVGRPKEASATLAAWLEMQERYGLPTRFARRDLAFDDYYGGRWEQATRLVAELLAPGHDADPLWDDPALHALDAALRLAGDDIQGAAAECERALEIARAQQQDAEGLASLRFLLFLRAEIALAESRPAAANQLVDTALAISGPTYPNDTILIALVLADLGREQDVVLQAASARPSDAWAQAAAAIARGQLEHAADRLADLGDLPSEAAVRLRAASALVKAGQQPEAAEQLHKALSFYRSVGATRYIRQAETLLAASQTERKLAAP